MNTDILNQDIKVGDFVVFIIPNKKYLVIGEVKLLTPKGCTINYYCKDGTIKSCNRPYNRILKITEQKEHAYNTHPERFI